MELFLGIDLGTSGCRAIAIDNAGQNMAEATVRMHAPVHNGQQVTQNPELWWQTVTQCLLRLVSQLDPDRINTIAVAGTSGTLLLCDTHGNPLTPAFMYNDTRATTQAERIRAFAPAESGAHGASGGLAKLLWLQDHTATGKAAFALHQTDWINGKLSGRWGTSDYNNALKLGFDPLNLVWPDWLDALGVRTELLPQVDAPGAIINHIRPEIARRFGLSATVNIVTGTTDGVAAFLAANGERPGHAVTSLGSTLVLKLLSDKPVFSPRHGVYSHRLGDLWLAGGASNSGGVVLHKYFSVTEMERLTPTLAPDQATGLDYYPLTDAGERFPICDPTLQPRLAPRADTPATFFQGLLEGISRIEADGYRLLTRLGAPEVLEIRTTGRGSHNPAWTRIRERIIKVPIKPARSEQAAYGAALLAAGHAPKKDSIPRA